MMSPPRRAQPASDSEQIERPRPRPPAHDSAPTQTHTHSESLHSIATARPARVPERSPPLSAQPCELPGQSDAPPRLGPGPPCACLPACHAPRGHMQTTAAHTQSCIRHTRPASSAPRALWTARGDAGLSRASSSSPRPSDPLAFRKLTAHRPRSHTEPILDTLRDGYRSAKVRVLRRSDRQGGEPAIPSPPRLGHVELTIRHSQLSKYPVCLGGRT